MERWHQRRSTVESGQFEREHRRFATKERGQSGAEASDESTTPARKAGPSLYWDDSQHLATSVHLY
ncbi:LOW QUALITY PROTEIN: Hypothetical protein PHPALM_8618 [Phytophthora palmivora]|uniref:Uncharacterized protein n=1 Tax=Phytophthora palmivora TaxID=4796 RepID=A0A2P4Y9D8_9STRA|nr:LOW QUALITY PROTEIN: Hypothetical protein PHPALM_8618 [Phytophthora palmivora]